MGLSTWNGSSWVATQDLKVWNGSAWVQGCAHVWDGSQWVQFFGQNGTVSAGPGGSFTAALATSDSASSAGSGIRLKLLTNGTLQLVSERGGTIDPGGYGIETVLSTSTYTPTPCSPDPPLLSARVVYVSGNSEMRIQGPAYDAWAQLGTVDPNWGFFAQATVGTGVTISKTVTITLQLALSSNLSSILASANYTFSGSALSEAEGPPE
jgi:hypothetical protein